jgi:acetate kinase
VTGSREQRYRSYDPDDGNVRDVLVLNAGSSSIKFAVLYTEEMNLALALGQVAGLGTHATFEAGGNRYSDAIEANATHAKAVDVVFDYLKNRGLDVAELDAVGHRFVHGGSKYAETVLVEDEVEDDLRGLTRLAPLHMPHCLEVLRKARELAPNVRQFACFDTAFHATQPELATRLPLPREYHARGYRRYGFHGLSYEFIVATLPKITGKPLPKRLLAAHLGSGASMCAILDGRSIATTMGFSTADGLVMATRTGSIDPGVLLALMRDDHLDVPGMEDLLYRRSGLLGLSGISGDMRTLLASPAPEAREAIDYYCYSAARHAGSLIAVLGGVDALVFTGGVGENAAPIRARIAEHLKWLGLSIDPRLNQNNQTAISPPAASCQVYVIRADEEFMIAQHTIDALYAVS